MPKLEIGQLLLIDSEVWRIVADYTDVYTPIDYELVLVTNTDVWESYQKGKILHHIHNGDWKFIRL